MRRRTEHGYVLLATLLLVSLIVSAVTSYARHALLAAKSSQATMTVHSSREAATSGVAYARQVLQSGTSLGTSTLVAGEKTVNIAVSDAGGLRRAIVVDALVADSGARLLGEAEVVPLPQGALPTLSKTAAASAKTDSRTVIVKGSKTWSDMTFEGTAVLANGATLTLRDVVIKGTIASQSSLKGPPYDPADATTLIIDGGLRIEPTSVVPGCAIVMPDGAVTGNGNARVEIHGAIVADSFSMAGSGAITGNIATTSPAILSLAVDRPGQGREPVAWPSALEFTHHAVRWLAFPRGSPTPTEKKAIQKYAFK